MELDQSAADKLAVARRNTALPSDKALSGEKALDGLPAIDWKAAGISNWLMPKSYTPKPPPEGWQDDSPLPPADVVVVTWTVAEWAAMNHVLCDYKRPFPMSVVYAKTWRKPWIEYARDYYTIHQYMVNVDRTRQGGAPSLASQSWGSWRMVRIAGLRVLLLKSGMHLAQDGTDLPLCQLVEQILEEVEPSLVLSIGTAGGVRVEDALGSAVITNQAYFHLLDELRNAPFNHSIVESDWQPPDDLIDKAQELVLQVPGCIVLPPSPQYPEGAEIRPDAPDSRLKIVTDQPIITTDTYLFGTTTNGLEKLGCAVEMDDAVVGMVCDRQSVDFGFVRNISDPVINGKMPWKLQQTWAGYIYEECGLFTSFNSALAAWAVIAGGR